MTNADDFFPHGDSCQYWYCPCLSISNYLLAVFLALLAVLKKNNTFFSGIPDPVSWLEIFEVEAVWFLPQIGWKSQTSPVIRKAAWLSLKSFNSFENVSSLRLSVFIKGGCKLVLHLTMVSLIGGCSSFNISIKSISSKMPARWIIRFDKRFKSCDKGFVSPHRQLLFDSVMNL